MKDLTRKQTPKLTDQLPKFRTTHGIDYWNKTSVEGQLKMHERNDQHKTSWDYYQQQWKKQWS